MEKETTIENFAREQLEKLTGNKTLRVQVTHESLELDLDFSSISFDDLEDEEKLESEFERFVELLQEKSTGPIDYILMCEQYQNELVEFHSRNSENLLDFNIYGGVKNGKPVFSIVFDIVITREQGLRLIDKFKLSNFMPISLFVPSSELDEFVSSTSKEKKVN